MSNSTHREVDNHKEERTCRVQMTRAWWREETREEGKRKWERTRKRVGDKTCWPVEAECQASLHRPKGADGQREGEEDTEINSVRTGFIPPGPQNWAGPRRESEEEGRWGWGSSGAIYIILFWTKEDICERESKREIWTSVHVEVLNRHIWTHKSVNKGLLSLEGQPHQEQNSLLSSWGGVIHPKEQQKQDGDKDNKKEYGNPALSLASGEICNSKVN